MFANICSPTNHIFVEEYLAAAGWTPNNAIVDITAATFIATNTLFNIHASPPNGHPITCSRKRT